MNRLFAACLACHALLCTNCTSSPARQVNINFDSADSLTKTTEKYLSEAIDFIRNNDYEQNFCFMVNMHMASGDNRFFVYDLKVDSMEFCGKVTHGRCNEEWLEEKRYSNMPGSGCSSLGKYRIGKSYKGRFGLSYKLYGLDSTNSNAFQRAIVLHAHDCVPEANAVQPAICQSDGCVMVSPAFLLLLKKKISSASKPVLLWLYDDNH